MDKATICPCGAVVEPRPGRGRPRKFCSSCSRVDLRRRYEKVARKRSCQMCGESFEGIASARYCSNSCHQRTKVGRACDVCGEPTTSFAANQRGFARHKTCLSAEHGTGAQYRRGCRCNPCKLWNREAQRLYREKRRAEGRPIKHFGSSGPWINPKVRVAVYERDNWTCQACGVLTPLEGDPNGNNYPSLDHIVPQSKGGSHDITNLRLLCRWCNCVRGNGDYHQDLFGEAS